MRSCECQDYRLLFSIGWWLEKILGNYLGNSRLFVPARVGQIGRSFLCPTQNLGLTLHSGLRCKQIQWSNLFCDAKVHGHCVGIIEGCQLQLVTTRTWQEISRIKMCSTRGSLLQWINPCHCLLRNVGQGRVVENQAVKQEQRVTMTNRLCFFIGRVLWILLHSILETSCLIIPCQLS